MRRTPLGESERLIALAELLKLQEIGPFPDEAVQIEDRVFVEQLLPNSIAHQSGRVLAGDEIVEIQGGRVRVAFRFPDHIRIMRKEIADNWSGKKGNT